MGAPVGCFVGFAVDGAAVDGAAVGLAVGAVLPLVGVALGGSLG